ncbi:MAG: M60 family metallopeptidase, partial [Bacteroidales bacterium]|nr:M60 family metallopeptidase [Bacteroidales bacterium]
WPFVEQASNLYHATAGDGFSMTASSEKNPASGYWMHYGAGNYCVVGWDANSTASQWLATEVNISESDLQANWEEVALLNGASGKVAEYQGYLNNLFTDQSCTTPKKSLTSASAIEADADYQKLPTGLQAMVKKVYLDDWGENNIVSTKAAWSSKHAKRFRVQQYEPYSYAERTNSMLGIYAHSNMNNPTGLVANQRNLLYIMVEGEIKEGAKLYIQSLVGEDRLSNIGGVELTEGLNIVPYWSDGNQLFIQYVVNTYENGAKTGHKLSQYEPLKIHIEGGCINGCFDTVGDALNPADTDEDWDAYEVRAHQYNFTVLGKYMMWHMPLVIDDSNTDYLDLSECLGTKTTSVKTAMDAWETIESAQRLMEGLLSEQEINTIPNASRVFEYTGNDPDEQYPSDYSEEYNNRSMAYSTKDGYFMFAADWSTHYASNTLDDVIRDIATGGDPWGPAHEIGHTYQGPINLPSTSETSNNAIANVSNWFMGRTSSRLGSTQSLLDQYNNNTSFLGTDVGSGNVWEKLMMYTKLWFYYHVTGHNKKFYPRLFEMLRRDPIARDKGVALSGNKTMLKFYKYACMAAEEDLTDFFEVFGFFVPVDGRLSDDYGDFKTVMTQAEIDAAKAEVAAMAAENGWKKNTAI